MAPARRARWPAARAITFYSNITIQNGSVSEVKEYLASGIKAKDTWTGGVENNALNLTDEGQNERANRWLRKLTRAGRLAVGNVVHRRLLAVGCQCVGQEPQLLRHASLHRTDTGQPGR